MALMVPASCALRLFPLLNHTYQSLNLLQIWMPLSPGSLIGLPIDTQTFRKQLSPGLPPHVLPQFFGTHPDYLGLEHLLMAGLSVFRQFHGYHGPQKFLTIMVGHQK